MTNRIGFLAAGIMSCALSVAPTIAAAQSPSFVSTWRSEISTVGAGGYTVVIDMEYVFQPTGAFSAMTTSRYGNGPAAGGRIGAVQSVGTYKVNAGQSIISFHADKTTMTQKVTVAKDENDRYRFVSATALAMQSMIGGPVVTFQKAQ